MVWVVCGGGGVRVGSLAVHMNLSSLCHALFSLPALLSSHFSFFLLSSLSLFSLFSIFDVYFWLCVFLYLHIYAGVIRSSHIYIHTDVSVCT